MFNEMEFLPWDSEFFGFRIARVTGGRLLPDQWEQVRKWCHHHHIRCLYYEADISDFASLATASNAGFIPVDVRIVFEHTIDPSKGRKNRAEGIRSLGTEDLCRAQPILFELSKWSRFSFDPNFPRGVAGKMYEIWMRNICQSPDGIVLGMQVGEEIAGIAALKCELNEGRIVLIGVRSDFHGRGVGRHLIDASLDWFQERGCSIVRVTTQGRNVPAQRFYQKAGFLVYKVSIIYHKWFDQKEG